MEVFVTKTGSIHAPDNLTACEAEEWAKTQPDSAFQWEIPDWKHAVALSKNLVEKLSKQRNNTKP